MGRGRRREFRKMTFQWRDIKYNSRLEIVRLRLQLAASHLANQRQGRLGDVPLNSNRGSKAWPRTSKEK